MHQQGPVLCRRPGKIPHSLVVDNVSRGIVPFRPVHIGICGTVHYHIHPAAPAHSRHGLAHGRSIRDVKRPSPGRLSHIQIRKIETVAAVRRNIPQLMSQLPVRSCNQYIHVCPFQISPWLQRPPPMLSSTTFIWAETARGNASRASAVRNSLFMALSFGVSLPIDFQISDSHGSIGDELNIGERRNPLVDIQHVERPLHLDVWRHLDVTVAFVGK